MEPPDSAQVNKIFDVLSSPRNQPVFIHCQHGKDRTEWLEMGFAIRFLKNLDQFFSDSVN